jgi:hypothetical protein
LWPWRSTRTTGAFGSDVPVYYLTGTLIDGGDGLSVTLFLNDPATDEVLWSGAYGVDRERFVFGHQAALRQMLDSLGLEPGEGVTMVDGDAAELHWVAQYLWQLESREAAAMARQVWDRALEIEPTLPDARAGLQALAALVLSSTPRVLGGGRGDCTLLRSGSA